MLFHVNTSDTHIIIQILISIFLLSYEFECIRNIKIKNIYYNLTQTYLN